MQIRKTIILSEKKIMTSLRCFLFKLIFLNNVHAIQDTKATQGRGLLSGAADFSRIWNPKFKQVSRDKRQLLLKTVEERCEPDDSRTNLVLFLSNIYSLYKIE